MAGRILRLRPTVSERDPRQGETAMGELDPRRRREASDGVADLHQLVASRYGGEAPRTFLYEVVAARKA